jgi:hypothetical protein
MSANLRHAAGLARGRYLKILCADDWLAANCLEAMHALMETHRNVSLATSAEIRCGAGGTPLRVQFLFGRPLSIIAGETMLDRMARGQGFGGNSSFFIRAAAYERVGGFDSTIKYAPDYDLGARLCRAGAYLHTDEPLFYGRQHEAASSVVNPALLLDVIDWFELPARLFQPRRWGNREWRRYHRLIASLTARYLFNVVVDLLRGRREYGLRLLALVLRYGNLWCGVPLLAIHIPARLWRRVARALRPEGRPPETWMAAPLGKA